MMNGSDQSETASCLAQSWPTSPKRSVAVMYYVQSPSRDSQEEDKSSTNQCNATPTSCRSSTESPTTTHYYHSSTSLFGRSSRPSSASRVSSVRMKAGGRRLGEERQRWRGRDEEGGGEEYYADARRGYQVWGGVMGFVGVFTLFCLVIWGASRPFAPHIAVKSLLVHELHTGEGSDSRGVPTRMITVNASVTMRVHNPATFFGIHVQSTHFTLMYCDLVVAFGKMKGYYQPRKSSRDVNVSVESKQLPLYGANIRFASAVGVPMKLVFELGSKGYVVGKLVKSQHQVCVSCSLAMDANYPAIIQIDERLCQYHP